jgi:hypothetical protein
MRQDRKEELKALLGAFFLLAGMFLMIIVLGGCGSGGGGALPPGPYGEGIAITCMDASIDALAACEGVQEVVSKPRRSGLSAPLFRTVIYNAGDIRTGATIWAQAEVTNFTAFDQPVYFYTEFNEGGDFNGNTAQTYRQDLLAGETMNAQYGSNFCPDPGPCAHEGYWEVVTYIYNASHLAPDASEHGDPAGDEILFKGILMFNLRSGL